MSTLFERHQKTLDDAVSAIRSRAYFSAYPEIPSGKIYGETARKDGQAAFQGALNNAFAIDQPASGAVGAEQSPYGFDLGITYPKPDLDTLLPAAEAAMGAWKHTDAETRVGVCLEILHRLNKRSFEMGFAVMHTTGQGFMMAFQAGGPHAQDRGLEALAYAWEELQRCPRTATWEKRVGKEETVVLNKTFRVVPRGVGVVIGCSTFPTWNSYPGLFASLVTGNAVVVKPHPGAILPLAITVRIAREVLTEEGFDPNLVVLAADAHDDPITKTLVTRPEVRIIDYTGGSPFGEWIEANATQAVVYTEKAGVNSIVIDGLDDMRAVSGNLGFSLSLYSGQMCTTSQNVFIPRDGVDVGGEHKSFDDVASAIIKAVDWLLGDAKRGAEILGAIQSERTLARIDQTAAEGGTVLRPSGPVENEMFPDARVRSPLIMKVDAADEKLFMREMFGPIVYFIATDDTKQSLELATRAAREHGAITCALYSTDASVIAAAEEATADAGVPLSCNLTGSIWVNQSAAFSDFHVSGANPSGNATLCDPAFVVGRFRIVQSRIPVSQAAPVG
ncbi:MAG: phenylacetic acid degradation protein PaaN [Planctomycetes bacterium]|nr:phenylacetic acid degradation protein PaaN [Planctomycetota bacterium]